MDGAYAQNNSGFPWGKPFTYSFYPLIDDQPVETSDDAPTIYVYADSSPVNVGTARIGTGSPLQTINSWQKNGAFRRDISVAAIPDPTPDQLIFKRWYWIGINFTLTAGGQVQTLVKSLEMVRVKAQHRQVETNEFSLTAIYPGVTTYADSAKITRQIDQAKREIQSFLRNAGYEWAQIYRPDRLSDAVAYRALSLIMIGQSQRPGDHFDKKFAVYEGMYVTHRDGLKFEYDTANTGRAITTETQSGFMFVTR